ncbi:arginine decarboxylase, partial [Candidatus Endoriftia persephone str. Guaymas]|nr:arginine decarboxylase [Candidatus Endoriftia persephone str. Guaymas]
LVYPAIITESGRALTAHHSLLISNLIDREAAPGAAVTPAESDQTLPVLAQLSQLLGSEASPLELFEQAQELLDQARREFELGALSLAGRARAEQLFYAICRELQPRLAYSSRRQRELIERIHLLLADKLFLNFSLFQSMPDAWAIEQIFPVVPLQRLDEVPDRRGVVHDLTCDSDGCIEHYVEQGGVEASLPVHAPRAGEAYYLGIFLLGAYQEILGDIHNLFGDSDAVNLELDGQGGYRLLEPERGDSVDELLSYVHFDPRAMEIALRTRLNQAGLDKAQRDHFFAELKSGLYGYTYLED